MKKTEYIINEFNKLNDILINENIQSEKIILTSKEPHLTIESGFIKTNNKKQEIFSNRFLNKQINKIDHNYKIKQNNKI
jgi:hypothetical protein